MSDAFIFVGGGGGKGGGRKSQILANAPSGSVVTCSNGTVTKTATSNGMVAFKDLDFGTWTLTATLDNGTATETVEITKIGIVYVDLCVTWLYRNGNEYTDLTGGWESSQITPNGYTYLGAATLTKNAGNMLFSGYRYTMWTGNAIDLANYTTLNLKGTLATAQDFEIFVSETKANSYTKRAYYSNASHGGSATNIDAVIDISGISSTAYIAIALLAVQTDLTITEIKLL